LTEFAQMFTAAIIIPLYLCLYVTVRHFFRIFLQHSCVFLHRETFCKRSNVIVAYDKLVLLK